MFGKRNYHYDPVGNITDIRDTAQQTVYFNNSVVEAANSYTYDATYRLIEATGREHSTQGTTQRTDVQITPGPQPMTSDPSAMRRYTQKFTYDEVGNILKMQHIPASGSGWTRYYEYDADGNRLEKTSAPGDPANGPYTHAYTYDAHGNMTAMPHLSSMVWNHDDELREVTVGTETVYFQYAGGMRSRKYVEKSGATTEERIYLGPFEIYRKRISGTLNLERESLHISDDTGRICILETKTVDGGSAVGSPTGIWRYQLSNHLGSAATEVDGTGAVISYEEYHPYGTSAYRAVNASIDVSAKRYRYTGMERDEETGLEYRSARYYASWLGRWAATDPIGLDDGMDRYSYASNRPTVMADPSGTEGGWSLLEGLQQEYRKGVEGGRSDVQPMYGYTVVPDAVLQPDPQPRNVGFADEEVPAVKPMGPPKGEITSDFVYGVDDLTDFHVFQDATGSTHVHVLTPEEFDLKERTYRAAEKSSDSSADFDYGTTSTTAAVEGQSKMEREAATKAREMLAAAREELVYTGSDPEVIRVSTTKISIGSAFRDADDQLQKWNDGYYNHYSKFVADPKNKIKDPADVDPAKLARYIRGLIGTPGFSNHQRGVAIDILNFVGLDKHGKPQKVSKDEWEETPLYRWLVEEGNAEKYGFRVLGSEPWHYEFVPAQ